jgi:hypothetical protein
VPQSVLDEQRNLRGEISALQARVDALEHRSPPLVGRGAPAAPGASLQPFSGPTPASSAPPTPRPSAPPVVPPPSTPTPAPGLLPVPLPVPLPPLPLPAFAHLPLRPW